MDPEKVNFFAETDSRNKRVRFGIKAKDRAKHMYVIGKTGMGKSTLLENMAIQDIRNGEGIAFIDPHGGTAEKLLEYVPKERIKDVLYFAPFDMEHPISFNVMEDIGVDKRHLVVNGLMSTFEKIWVDAWSARMAYILNNTLLALLEYPGATLLGVNRMLSDKDYRKKVVDNVSDPSVKAFWVEEFGKYTERFAAEATPAIQNKVGQFTSNPLVRNLIGQAKSTFDIRKIMDEKKILIINLSKGKVGEGNANLIGSMLITKIYLAALSRADSTEAALKDLPNFYLYVDEFQTFANKSFADILSEARKYKLNLTIAHQYIEQMEEEVRDAVFGNVGTMVVFRVGAYDAEVLEKEFAPTFTAEDLVNLGFVQIYLKLMIDGISSAPFSATTMAPLERPEISYKHDVIESSRAMFSRPRAIVEEEIKRWHEEGTRKAEPKSSGQAQPYSGAVKDRKEVKVEEQNLPRKDEKQQKQEIFAGIMAEEQKKREVREQQQEPKPQSQPLTAVKPVENRNIPSKPISLDTLKPNQSKNDKNPTPEHVSELRKALSALTGNPQQGIHQRHQTVYNKPQTASHHEQTRPTPASQNVNAPGANNQQRTQNNDRPANNNREAPQTNKQSQSVRKDEERKKPREIPEDELRKLLHVDTN